MSKRELPLNIGFVELNYYFFYDVIDFANNKIFTYRRTWFISFTKIFHFNHILGSNQKSLRDSRWFQLDYHNVVKRMSDL